MSRFRRNHTPGGAQRIKAELTIVALLAAAITALVLPLSGAARAQAAPVNTSTPTISGTPVKGGTLVAGTGSWSGTEPIGFAFAWMRCDGGGANCVAIAGATNTTYVLQDADVGARIRVLVTASNAEGTGSALSAATDIVTQAGAPQNTGEPSISGSPGVGQKLSASSGSWTGAQPITFSYQWVRCGSDGGNPDGSNCPFISGATGTSYVLTSSDVGSRIRVRVTATNSLGSQTAASNPTVPVTANAPVNTKEPSISGSPVVGQKLSTNSGSWSGAQPIKLSFQWVRCGSDGGKPDGSNCASISHATGTSYVLTSSDVGSRIRVRVTASNSGGSLTVASNPTTTVKANAPVNTKAPTISGSTVQGQALTVNPGSWTGPAPITMSYQWLRCNSGGGSCGSIKGATSTQYKLTSSDVGHRLRVNVTARNSRGSTTVMSGATATVTAPAGPAGVIVLPSGEKSIPVTSVPKGERLIVQKVVFTPRRVQSRVAPISIQVRVKDTRGYVVRGAMVFIRSTPLVTKAAQPRRPTSSEGYAVFQMTPRANFPKKRRGALQFFVKAYRTGDNKLAGIAGYRLVQVRIRR
jgi:fibronectin type 3 domain-containing protein